MISIFRKPAIAGAAESEESWDDSAFWGASLALLLVVLLLFGVGYVGYASLERPNASGAAAAPPPVVAPARAR